MELISHIGHRICWAQRTLAPPRYHSLNKQENIIVIDPKKEDNKVSWQTYELKIKINKEPKPDDECILVDSGITTFSDIPIICLEMPKELNVGKLVGNLCADHYKRYSSLIFAENRSLFALPVYKQGEELSSSAISGYSEINQDVGRGQRTSLTMRQKGFAVIGPTDEISFAEPAGNSYQLVSDQLKELVDEIHRVTHLIANSIASSKNSNTISGVSKLMDNRSKEIVLSAYGELVKAFVINMYNIISTARKEDIEWQALGLDDYKLTMDRDQLL